MAGNTAFGSPSGYRVPAPGYVRSLHGFTPAVHAVFSPGLMNTIGGDGVNAAPGYSVGGTARPNIGTGFGIKFQAVDGVPGFHTLNPGYAWLNNCGDTEHIAIWAWVCFTGPTDAFTFGRGADGSGDGWSMRWWVYPTGEWSQSCVTVSGGAMGSGGTGYGVYKFVPGRWYHLCAVYSTVMYGFVNGHYVFGWGVSGSQWRSSGYAMNFGMLNGSASGDCLIAQAGWGNILALGDEYDHAKRARDIYLQTSKPYRRRVFAAADAPAGNRRRRVIICGSR